jgi:hypothetical protein
MTIDEKIQEARRLMFEVSAERKALAKAEKDNLLCKCFHKHSDHSESYSINYTAGFCSKCDCEHFLMEKA